MEINQAGVSLTAFLEMSMELGGKKHNMVT